MESLLLNPFHMTSVPECHIPSCRSRWTQKIQVQNKTMGFSRAIKAERNPFGLSDLTVKPLLSSPLLSSPLLSSPLLSSQPLLCQQPKSQKNCQLYTVIKLLIPCPPLLSGHSQLLAVPRVILFCFVSRWAFSVR